MVNLCRLFNKMFNLIWPIVFNNNYLARRLVISLFSAALWAPVAEATSRGTMRADRREEEAIVRLLVVPSL